MTDGCGDSGTSSSLSPSSCEEESSDSSCTDLDEVTTDYEESEDLPCDLFEEAPPPLDVLYEQEWEKGAQDVRWRWWWLELRVADLSRQIAACDDEYRKLRDSKPRVVPAAPSLGCLRATGMVPPPSHRVLTRRPPCASYDAAVAARPCRNHPLLSLKCEPFDPAQTERRRKAKAARAARKRKSKPSSAASPGSPGVWASQSPGPPNGAQQKKRGRGTLGCGTRKSYNEMARSLGYGGEDYRITSAVGATFVPQTKAEEIKIPVWREVAPPELVAGPVEGDDGQETSDEAYARVHCHKESLERLRFVAWVEEQRSSCGCTCGSPRNSLRKQPCAEAVSPLAAGTAASAVTATGTGCSPAAAVEGQQRQKSAQSHGGYGKCKCHGSHRGHQIVDDLPNVADMVTDPALLLLAYNRPVAYPGEKYPMTWEEMGDYEAEVAAKREAESEAPAAAPDAEGDDSPKKNPAVRRCQTVGSPTFGQSKRRRSQRQRTSTLDSEMFVQGEGISEDEGGAEYDEGSDYYAAAAAQEDVSDDDDDWRSADGSLRPPESKRDSRRQASLRKSSLSHVVETPPVGSTSAPPQASLPVAYRTPHEQPPVVLVDKNEDVGDWAILRLPEDTRSSPVSTLPRNILTFLCLRPPDRKP